MYLLPAGLTGALSRTRLHKKMGRQDRDGELTKRPRPSSTIASVTSRDRLVDDLLIGDGRGDARARAGHVLGRPFVESLSESG